MSSRLKLGAIVAGLILTFFSCQDFTLLKDEEGSSTSGKEDSSDLQDAPDVADGQLCSEGDRKKEDCNTCFCSNSRWSCTKKGCQSPDGYVGDDGDSEDGELDMMDCDALGITWRFSDGKCFLEEWAGCGPSGVSFQNQKDCLEKNKVTAELKWLPAGDACKPFYKGSDNLVNSKACSDKSITENMACTGYGGPGCSGEECKTMEEMLCESGLKTLACRPVDFNCTEAP